MPHLYSRDHYDDKSLPIFDELKLAHDCVMCTLLFGSNDTPLVSSQSLKDSLRSEPDRLRTGPVEYKSFDSIESAIAYCEVKTPLEFERIQSLAPSINRLDEDAEQAVLQAQPQTDALLRQVKLEHLSKLKKLKDDHASEIANLEAKLDEQATTHLAELKQINSDHASQTSTLNIELNDRTITHLAELKAIETTYASEIANLTARLESQVKTH